jgi:RNase P/RNase MRP subunit p30
MKIRKVIKTLPLQVLAQSQHQPQAINRILVYRPHSVIKESRAHQQRNTEQFQVMVDILFSRPQSLRVHNDHVDNFVILIVGN